MNGASEVIFHIPSLLGGGAERVAVEISRYFLSTGVRPIFFVHTKNNSYALPDGVELIVSSKSGHISRVLELRRLIKRRVPVAILSFLPYANLISISAIIGLRRTPRIVVSEHLTCIGEKKIGLMHFLKWILVRCFYQYSDSIVAVSEGVANDLRGTLMGGARDKISVINNPCFIPDAEDFIFRPEKTEISLLAVGRLVDDKGFDVLIRAVANARSRIGNFQLIIAGEGPCRPELEKLIADYSLTECVRMPGFTRDVRTLYRGADLFICSSRREGFGNVIVEALSFGLKIVSTQCPHGPQEILANGRFGVLVPVNDDVALANAIVEALHSPVSSESQIARAREYSLDVIGNLYLEKVGLAAFSCRYRAQKGYAE
ncbi:glycosyltransferase [Paraburkholderia sp. J94]|uniref:glycosyltransferase n=1 Tax=Paraburkholderia sp. J94 TaxID=2805441 RepID=UPI002AB132E4|nr:glycosyltransferase [Paraburkholderia sp. J94]